MHTFKLKIITNIEVQIANKNLLLFQIFYDIQQYNKSIIFLFTYIKIKVKVYKQHLMF